LGPAKLMLRSINTKKLGADQRLEYSSLCRRTQMNCRGLRALWPLIQKLDQNSELKSIEDSKLISEYCILLMRTGGAKEALRRMEDNQLAETPELFMGRAYCHLILWDRETAAENMLRYLRFKLDPYQRLVGEVNLANAFIIGNRLDQSLFVLIEESMEKAQRGKHRRLLGNCFELRGQAHLKVGQLEKAEKDLQEAHELLQKEGSLGLLFVRKWQAVLEAQRRGVQEPILQFRAEVQKLGNWESVRSCDYELLLMEFDERRFEYLYFGSPLANYREMLLETFGTKPDKGEYIYGNRSGTRLDLETGFFGKQEGFNPGKKPHQLLTVLMKDFYKPVNSVEIFMDLYPDEVFNIETSLGRVQRVIGLTRAELKALKIPLEIEEVEGRYQLRLRKPMSIRIPLERKTLSAFDVQWAEFLSKAPRGKYFKSSLIREVLGFPSSSAKRFVLEALEQGKLLVRGAGRATEYLVKD